MFKPYRDILAAGMWNTIEDRVSCEYINLLITKIDFSSSDIFSLIKSILKSSLINKKIS